MNQLAIILGSQIRAGIFRLHFSSPRGELHIREIQHRTGFNDRAIRQELAKLARLELLVSRRDCHIESDWVLIYKIDGKHLLFERTGAHSDLFKS
jgi:addiction module RelE/StbE family toxin